MAAQGRDKPTKREIVYETLFHEWLGIEKPINLKRNLSSAGDWVDQIIKTQLFANSLDEQDVKAAWKDIAGDFISSHTEPVSVIEGHLVLRVTQPAMRFHLEQIRGDLLKKIQKRFGEEKVKSIRFGLG